MRRYTDEELLENLKLIAEDIKRIPSVEIYEKHPLHMYNSMTYVRHFGSWNKALKKAKISYNNKNFNCRSKFTKENVLSLIKKLIKKNNYCLPKYKEIEKDQKYGVPKHAIRRYFSSINDVYKCLGYTQQEITELKRGWKKISPDVLLQDLYNTAIQYPTISSVGKLISLSGHGHSRYIYYFKNSANVKKILYLKYGIKIYHQRSKQSNHHIKIKNIRKRHTNEELLNNLKLIADDLGHVPRAYEFQRHNLHICSENTIAKRFGSWNNAILAIQLTPTRQYSRASKEEILSNIKAVACDLNKIPLRKEYEKHPNRLVSSFIVKRDFGSWNNALKAAGLK